MVVSNLLEGNQIKVSHDLYGNQTYAGHFAEGLMYALQHDKLPRILHIASMEVISRGAFALQIAEKFELNDRLILMCSNNDVPGWVAKRPTQGGLDVSLADSLGIPIYSIQEGWTNVAKRFHHNSVLR